MNSKKEDSALARYRAGYTLVWKKAGHYCSGLKRFPKPNTCDKKNHHRGFMPSLKGDFGLSERQAATILEYVCEAPGTSYAQVRTVSAMLSYLHGLQTGIHGKNWKQVTQVLHAYDESDFKLIRKSLKPVVIPSPDSIRKAFATAWTPDCGVPFTLWCTMLLASWCWCIWGCRPNVDMKSLKESEVHADDTAQGWAWTAYDQH